MLVLGYHWELLFIAWSQQILEVAICEQTVLGPVNDSQATTLAALTLSTFFFQDRFLNSLGLTKQPRVAENSQSRQGSRNLPVSDSQHQGYKSLLTRPAFLLTEPSLQTIHCPTLKIYLVLVFL